MARMPRVVSLPGSIACLLGTSTALAQVAAPPVRTWTGPDGGNWNLPANWTGNTVPNSAADATINSTGGPRVTDAQAARILRVGETVTGSTLTIAGGVLTSFSSAFIGNAAGSSGTVNITGAGSAWRASSGFSLQVGVSGNGTLNILDGGNLTNLSSGVLSIASTAPGSVGAVNVDASTLSVTTMHVGAGGQGTLSIGNGSTAQSGVTNIGMGTAATPLATATLDGAGTSWTTTALTIGNRSDGRLNITNGASMTTNSAVFIANTDARIPQTGSGFVNIDAASWSISGNLAVGGVKDGTLELFNGSSLTVGDRLVSGSGSGVGRTLVDNSTLTVGQSDTVEIGGGSGGGAGAGFMTFRNGATGVFNIGVLNIAGRANSVPGTLLVEGPGTTLSVSGAVSMSNTASSALTLRDGAIMSTGGLSAGGGANGSATMLIDDATWNINGIARMGRHGTVDLRIQNGAEVNVTGPVELALNPTGRATITLAGTGGTFNATTLSGGEVLNDGTFSPAQGVATLNLEHSNAGQLFPAAILGNFTVNQIGPGTTIFTGDSTYTGTTTISGGTLQLGNGGLTGFIHGDIAIGAGGTLALNRNDPTDAPFTLEQTLSGAGTLRNIGPGTTILAGVNDYTGATEIEVGEVVASSLASTQVTVHDGARFSAHATGATLPGAVTVHGGGTLNPVGTLTLGSLFLDSGALLDYRLGVPTNTPGSEPNDRIVVSGNLTMGGAILDIEDLGGFSQGVYRIFDYGGVLTGGAGDLLLGAFPSGFAATDFTVQTAIGGQVNLVVSTGGLQNQWWDGDQTTDNATVDGGDGVWRLDRSNWTNAEGVVNATWAPGFAIFAGQAGIATLEEDIPVGGMQFVTDGYRIEPGGFVLRGDPDVTVRTDPAVTATIAAPLTDGIGGATELIKTGFGTLVLEGANSYSGGTRIVSGVLGVSADDNLGAAPAPLTFDNGVLHSTETFSSSRPVTIEQRGIFRTDAGTTLTLDGVIDGPGELIKQDAGTLELTGANLYGGGTTVAAGTLVIGADSALGDPGGALVLGGENRIITAADALGMPGGLSTGQGGTLRLSADVELAASRVIRLDEPGGIFDTNGFAGTVRQGIVGAGSLTKSGAGTLLLAGDNRYTGGTTISAGTLQLGDGGNASSVVGNIANQGTLAFNFGDALTFDGTISGSGALLKQGAGTLILTADHGYSGGTRIEAGTLQLGTGEVTGSLIGDVIDDGRLVFNRADASSFAGVISGSGAVEQLGSGTTTLTADNTYAGGTFFNDGVLRAASDAALGNASGGLSFDGGTLQFGAAFDVGNSRPIVLNPRGGTFDTNGFAVAVQQEILGAGSLTKSGAGTLLLTGDNHYTGGTRIDAGTLQLGDGGASGSLIGDVIDDGRLVFNRSDDLMVAGIISGSGAVEQSGSGTTTLTAANSYAGGTFLNGGVLQVAADAALGADSGGLSFDGGTLQFGAAFDIGNSRSIMLNPRGGTFDTQGFTGTVRQGIAGPGSLTKSGAGTLLLTGDNHYIGGTRIDAGTLQLGDGGASGSLIGDVIDNGRLVFNRADVFSFAGTISGSGAVEQSGSGSTSLTATNTYTGGTFLNDGVLRVATDAALGGASGGVSFNGGTLQLAAAFNLSGARSILLDTRGGTLDTHGFDTSLQQAVAGSGGLRKIGAGTLTFTGASSYVGPTDVLAGGLHVEGSLVSAVSIAQFARLSGNGAVGSLSNSGLVAPGASIGALTVNGDFVQGTTGTLEIEFDDLGHFDELLVSGAASLEGTVSYIPEPTSLFANDLLYTYLPAPGGVSGTFVETMSQDFAGVTFETLYNADSVQLRITSKPLPPNVDPAAGGDDLIACIGSLELQRSNNALGEDARLALSALINTSVASFLSAAIDTCPRDTSALPQAVHGLTVARAGTINSRIAQVHAGVEDPAVTGLFDSYRLRDGVEIWVKGTYQDGEADARDVMRQGFDSRGRGFTMGVDVAMAEAGVVGGYFAHEDLEVDYRGLENGEPIDTARAESSAWTAGLYGSYWGERRWFVQGSAEYGWHDLESRRDISVGGIHSRATGKRDAHNFAASLGAGYNVDPGRGWLLQPQATMIYDRFDDDGYTETGADALDLTLGDQAADTLRGEAGLTVRKSLIKAATRPDIAVIYVYANFIYDQALDNRSRSARFAISDTFEVQDTEKARNGIRYGLGFENTWANNASMQLLVDAEDYGEIETLGASLQFRMQF